MTDRTLLIRLAGPAQSWASSPYTVKATEGVPTKSGLLGILAGALGIRRGEPYGWLNDTVATVRVDRPGTVTSDYHTINPPPADVGGIRTRLRHAASAGTDNISSNWTVLKGGKGSSDPLITRRAYLADAEFIVAFNHPVAGRVEEMFEALAEPVFCPYLGRKAFTPSFPFLLGVKDGAAHGVLTSLPTSAPAGSRLALHTIEQDRNYASEYVTPVSLSPRSELWNGWKTI